MQWIVNQHSFHYIFVIYEFDIFLIFITKNVNGRHFSHVTKSRIFKNLNLRKKADRNFRGTFLKNRFRHLKLYSNPPSWLARSRWHIGTFWKIKDWSSHFWESQPFRFWYVEVQFNLIINWLLSDATSHRTGRPPLASPFDRIWREGDKTLNFQTFQWTEENLEMQSRLFKNSNFPSVLWVGKNLEIYTAPDQHFKVPMLNLWMSWKNLCPNLSFTIENKMENSHKKWWSHFNLKINDIRFPNILRICQWIGKYIFHGGKWNGPIKVIRECVRLKIRI